MKRIVWAFWLLVLVLAQAPLRAATAEVRACGGSNEWPPSSYFLRRDGRSTTEVSGFSPDVLAAALQGSGFEPQVELLPFARCLAQARAGHDMQIVMAAFHNEQRAQSFLYSDPYLALVPRVYFSPASGPRGWRCRR